MKIRLNSKIYNLLRERKWVRRENKIERKGDNPYLSKRRKFRLGPIGVVLEGLAEVGYYGQLAAMTGQQKTWTMFKE